MDQLTNSQALLDMIDNAGGFAVDRLRQPTRADRRRADWARFVVWTFENRPDVWTPAQLQAVVLFHARGLTQAEAARRIGITRRAFRDRLDAAEGHAVRAWGRDTGEIDVVPPTPSRYARNRPKKGRVAT